MTPEQIQRVRSTWAQAQPIQTQAAALFQGRLFAIAPEVQPMFKRDMVAQGNKLMAALKTLVLSLGRMEQMLPLARELAIRHVAWGVQPAHYTLVGEALLWTLRQGLADAATPALNAAWGEACASFLAR